jgi:hypothetical protein
MGELLKQALSSSVIAAMIVSMGAGTWKIIQDKRRNNQIEERGANDQLSEMRAAAETHLLEYDVPMRERVMQHEALINQLLLSNNQKPAEFPPIPIATPLFPRRKP